MELDALCKTYGSSRLRKEWLHGQDVLIPAADVWLEILEAGTLNGRSIPIPELIADWLERYSHFEEASLGLVCSNTIGWQIIPLLYLPEGTFRVHFEDVICDQCGRKNGPSAAPDTAAYAGTGYSNARIWQEFTVLPVRPCRFCKSELQRRQTIWLAEEMLLI